MNAVGGASPNGVSGMSGAMAGATMGGMGPDGMTGGTGGGAAAMAGTSMGGGVTAGGASGAGGTSAVGGMGTGGSGGAGDTLDDGTMTFFVTSTGMGDGGNLGGLEGADAFCAELATAVDPDFARRTWVAYLSTSTVDAVDRIGTGPWRNADNVIIANTVAQLHDPANAQPGGPLDDTWPIGDPSVPLDETGAEVPSGGGGANVHDILTGTLADGSVSAGATCEDWTSGADDPGINAQIGHSNRTGLAGQDQLWNTVHTVGCSQSGSNNVTQGGGRGSFYCFAVITGM